MAERPAARPTVRCRAGRPRSRRLLGAAATLLALLAPTMAASAASSAPSPRVAVAATSHTAGDAAGLTVKVTVPARLTRGTVRVALPAGWPRPQARSVGLDTRSCRHPGAARLTASGLVVGRLSCPQGASLSLRVRGHLPTTAGRYPFSTTLSGRAGRAGVPTSWSVRSSFTVRPAAADHLQVTPGGASVTYGGTRTLRAYAVDAYGNRRGEVTDRATFSMSPEGRCTGAVCGAGAHADVGGATHLVTAALGTLTGSTALSVEPRHVSVAARPATAVYGAADPSFGYDVDGLVEPDDALDGVTCGVGGAHVGVGTYAVTCQGSTDTDYVVDGYEPSTLTVTPAPLVVPVSGTQTYGGPPTFVPDLADAGLVNGDTAAVVGGTLLCRTAATASSGVGSYPISDCSGLSAANYVISYAYGDLEVTPLPVTVTADDQAMTAGDADPAFTYTTSPAGLDLAGVTCGVAGDHGAAGRYDITCTTTTDPDYEQVATVPGTLTVAPAPAVCGDGAVQPGEACDDGNAVTETSCPYGDATCNACNSTCSAALNLTGGYCGDGMLQPGAEVCDDGNTVTETSCPYGDATCNACDSTCSAALNLTGGYCGDGMVQPGTEVCDDGNTVTETSCPAGQATCSACSASCDARLFLTG